MSQQNCNCPDCGLPMHIETYENWKHQIMTTMTCKTPGCLLNSVTLTQSEWATKDLNPYRAINQRKVVVS